MTGFSRGGIAGALLLLLAPAHAWELRLPEAAGTSSPVVRGDLVYAALSVHGRARLVQAVATDDGAPVWRRRLGGDDVTVLGTARGAPLFVGGRGEDGGMLIARLSPHTGDVAWRQVFGNTRWGSDHVAALAIDADSDVIAAGTRSVPPRAIGGHDFTVVKLAGASGAVLWEFGIARPGGPANAATSAALDADGDVVAAGLLDDGGVGEPAGVVVKLRGRDGRLMWRHDVDEARDVRAVAIAPDGDVVIAASVAGAGRDFAVLRLAGDTGVVRWRFLSSASAIAWEGATDVLALPGGDVVALGVIGRRAERTASVVLRLDPAGALGWRRVIRGGWPAGRVVTLPHGALAVAAHHRCRGIVVQRLSARTGRLLGHHRLRTATEGCDQRPDEIGGLATTRDGHIVAAGSLTRQTRGIAFMALLER